MPTQFNTGDLVQVKNVEPSKNLAAYKKTYSYSVRKHYGGQIARVILVFKTGLVAIQFSDNLEIHVYRRDLLKVFDSGF